MTMPELSYLRDQTCIVGIGETAYTRGTPKSALELALEASMSAIADAGIVPEAIDAVILPGGAGSGGTAGDFCANLGNNLVDSPLVKGDNVQSENCSDFTIEKKEASWESDPHGLVSLWDMLRFYAATLVGIVRNLEILRHDFLVSHAFSLDDAPNWELLEQHLSDVEKHIGVLPLSRSLKEQVRRLQERAADHRPDNFIYMSALISELYNNIVTELTEHSFLLIPSEVKWLYLTPENSLGSQFEAIFPEAVKDACDGIRCFALDQWTASVFHFMRVLENGLRRLAAEVGLPSESMALDQWKNIIDQIVKKIGELEQLPKSQEKSVTLAYFSEAASNFRYFKDAWRNHVSHSRVTYDSKDAKRVMDHVIDFMQHLAKRISA